ncbi:MAG: hypothetical protein AAF603_03855 [Pseudomonadota bacterium]
MALYDTESLAQFLEWWEKEWQWNYKLNVSFSPKMGIRIRNLYV